MHSFIDMDSSKILSPILTDGHCSADKAEILYFGKSFREFESIIKNITTDPMDGTNQKPFMHNDLVKAACQKISKIKDPCYRGFLGKYVGMILQSIAYKYESQMTCRFCNAFDGTPVCQRKQITDALMILAEIACQDIGHSVLSSYCKVDFVWLFLDLTMALTFAKNKVITQTHFKNLVTSMGMQMPQLGTQSDRFDTQLAAKLLVVEKICGDSSLNSVVLQYESKHIAGLSKTTKGREEKILPKPLHPLLRYFAREGLHATNETSPAAGRARSFDLFTKMPFDPTLNSNTSRIQKVLQQRRSSTVIEGYLWTCPFASLHLHCGHQDSSALSFDLHMC